MRLVLEDVLSSPSGSANEDRGGARGDLAWVIDGATDVVPEPLCGGPSDAYWIAEQIHCLLTRYATSCHAELAQFPSLVAGKLKREFDNVAVRRPNGPEDYPSAAGLIIRLEGNRLSYVSVGDCSLILDDGAGGRHFVGLEREHAGDDWVAKEIRSHLADNPDADSHHVRVYLWPKLRAGRRRMNQKGGYGVFSISAPPDAFVRCGSCTVVPGARLMLASDGLMRLVDVFRMYATTELFAASWARGLQAVLAELRTAEAKDSQCVHFPRAKVSDDATGVLVSVAD